MPPSAGWFCQNLKRRSVDVATPGTDILGTAAAVDAVGTLIAQERVRIVRLLEGFESFIDDFGIISICPQPRHPIDLDEADAGWDPEWDGLFVGQCGLHEICKYWRGDLAAGR